ncbi:MAG: hypothetical protein HUJ25_13370 [Crocinitomicaceae bacterium]|nr:hypothetical protein [Crocinitomicaceae bacterium]
MANEVKLEAFHIKIRDRSGKKSKQKDRLYYYMGDVEGRDFYDIFLRFLDVHKVKFDRDKNLKRSFIVVNDGTKEDINPTSRYISGIIESGEFGFSSNIKDEIGTTVYAKDRVESVDIPFYFLIHIPKGKDRAILITQRTGVHGLSSILKHKLMSFVRDNYYEYILEIKSRLSKAMAEKILDEGLAKKLVLTRYVAPHDIADQLGDGIGDDTLAQEGIKIELSISSKGRTFLNLKSKLKQFIKNRDLKILDIEDFGFKEGGYTASVQMIHGGRPRIIDLSDTMNIKPYYDIEKDGLEKDVVDNHPIFSSINGIALEILEEMENETI